MTEYIVQPLTDHIQGPSAAEDAAQEAADLSGEPVGVYLLVTTAFPRKAA